MAYRPSRHLIISTAVILAAIGAFILILPEAVRRISVNRLENVLTVPVRIDDVDINLFTGRANLDRLVIGSEPRPIVSLPALMIDFSRIALLTGNLNLQTVVLRNPQVLLERLGPDSYNLLKAVRLLEQSRETEPRGPALSIQSLEIQGGELAFIDYTQDPDYEVTFSSLDLSAGPISTLPDASVTPTDFKVGLKIADGTVKLSGSSTLFGEAWETEMTAAIANVELQVFHAYLPYGGRLNLKDSLLNGQARYVLAHRDGKISKHSLEASFEIGGIGLAAQPTSQPMLRLAGLTARDIHVDLLENEAHIGALAVEEPYLLVKRDSSGFNLQQFLPESEAVAKDVKQNETDGLQMPLRIKQAEANGGAIEFIDQTISPTVKTLLQDVSFAATKLLVSPNVAAEQIAVEAQVGKGSVRVTGAIHDEPSKGQFSVTAERLPFQPYSGYLNQLFSSALSSGDTIDGKLKVALSPEENAAMITTLSGNLEGHNMALEFPDKEKPFLTTKHLGVDLRAIQLGADPRVDIDQIAFVGANLRIVRNKDGTLNLTRLWTSEEQENSEPAQKQAQETKTSVAIRSIAIEKSAIEVLDRSVAPNYTTRVSQVNGKLSNLVSGAKRADVRLQGVLGDSAKLVLTGWFTPFTDKPLMQLQATIRSYDLPPLNPYATEYVSHRIRQGQITMDVNYALKGNEIEATAEIVLRNVRVGEKTNDDFVNRIGIPLELAIALLKDIQGVIRLQVAMSGDRGPQLNIGNLIWNAVRNAIVRAITAPFRLVGNILTFGGRIGGIQIEPIVFQPATREISPEGSKQLDRLAELLKEKPELELKLKGMVSERELDALKKKKFWQRIQAAEGKDYEEALIRVYRDMGGITKPTAPLDSVAEESLERFVLERINVDEEELRRLARDRAEIVKDELASRGINPERLVVSAREVLAKGETGAVEVELVS